MPLFITVFVPPDPPAGLLIEAEVLTSRVALSWSADAGIAPADFVAYQVYRSTDGGATYQRLASIGSQTTTTFSDYEAPLGTSLLYRVAQQTLDFESDPAEAAAILDTTDQWWIVTPGVEGQTFRLLIVTDYSDSLPIEEDHYTALGRPRRVVVQGEVLGHEGSVTAHLSPENRPLYDLVAAAASARVGQYVVLKTPFGEVYRVVMGSIGRKRGKAGHLEITFPFTEVA